MKAKTSLERQNDKMDEQTLADLNSAHRRSQENVSEYEPFTLNGLKLVSLLAI